MPSLSLQDQVTNLALRISTECKALRLNTGALTGLPTTNKSSIVAAINELAVLVANAGAILDTAGAGVVNRTWSADKIITELGVVKNQILGGASGAFDTLLEIEAKLSSSDGVIGSLTTLIGEKVSYAAAQTLTEVQKQQARDNIGAVSKELIGDLNTDFVATFESGLL